MATKQANALADWVASKDKNLQFSPMGNFACNLDPSLVHLDVAVPSLTSSPMSSPQSMRSVARASAMCSAMPGLNTSRSLACHAMNLAAACVPSAVT